MSRAAQHGRGVTDEGKMRQNMSVKDMVTSFEVNGATKVSIEEKSVTPTRKMLKTKLKNVTRIKLEIQKMTEVDSQEDKFSRNDNNVLCLSLSLEDKKTVEDVTSLDKLRLSHQVGDILNQSEQPKRLKSDHAKGGGPRKETKNEAKLRTTAKKLNLKKISSIFQPIPVGGREASSAVISSQQTLGLDRMSWGGETCTVQAGSTICASQSEMERQGVAKRHLGLGASLGCDWTGGLEQDLDGRT